MSFYIRAARPETVLRSIDDVVRKIDDDRGFPVGVCSRPPSAAGGSDSSTALRVTLSCLAVVLTGLRRSGGCFYPWIHLDGFRRVGLAEGDVSAVNIPSRTTRGGLSGAWWKVPSAARAPLASLTIPPLGLDMQQLHRRFSGLAARGQLRGCKDVRDAGRLPTEVEKDVEHDRQLLGPRRGSARHRDGI